MHAEINRSTVPSVWRVYQLSDYAGGFATSLINCWKHLANICSWFQGSTFRGFSDKSWLPCLCAKSRLSSTSCPTSLSYRELHQDWLVPNVFYRCSNQPWCSYRGCTSEKLQGKMARSSVKAEVSTSEKSSLLTGALKVWQRFHTDSVQASCTNPD